MELAWLAASQARPTVPPRAGGLGARRVGTWTPFIGQARSSRVSAPGRHRDRYSFFAHAHRHRLDHYVVTGDLGHLPGELAEFHLVLVARHLRRVHLAPHHEQVVRDPLSNSTTCA